MGKIKFATQEFADLFKNSLNSNPNYKKSAAKWEGELILIFKAENKHLKEDVRLWLDLYHGECRAARFLLNDEQAPHEFTISAKESAWNDLIRGKIDGNKALLTGKFKIRGNLSKLMRYPRAAGYIIKYLKRHLIEQALWQ